MKVRRQDRGFTLIELLIVIAIIGTLSSLLLANFAGVRGRARDARRKADFDAIKKALRIYYNDNQVYPDTATFNAYWDGQFAVGGTVYMGRVPLDPVDNAPYEYSYSSPIGGDTDQFCLVTELEGTADEGIGDSQARCPACNAGGNEYVVCAD